MSGNDLMSNIAGAAPDAKPTDYADIMNRLANAIAVGGESLATGQNALRPYQALQLQREAQGKQLSDAEQMAIRHMYDMDKNVQDHYLGEIAQASPRDREMAGIRTNQLSAEDKIQKYKIYQQYKATPKFTENNKMFYPTETFDQWLATQNF